MIWVILASIAGGHLGPPLPAYYKTEHACEAHIAMAKSDKIYGQIIAAGNLVKLQCVELIPSNDGVE